MEPYGAALLTFPEHQRGRESVDFLTRVDAHGVDVLDGADNDDVIVEVAHDLELVLLPSDEGDLNEDLKVWMNMSGYVDA